MGILLVYDVTDEASFSNIRNWMKNIEQHASDNVVKASMCRSQPASQSASSGWAEKAGQAVAAINDRCTGGGWSLLPAVVGPPLAAAAPPACLPLLPTTACLRACVLVACVLLLQVLVGNKSDMDESKRAVPYSRGQALADEFRMQFFETSAKNNTNVDEVFQVRRWGARIHVFVCGGGGGGG